MVMHSQNKGTNAVTGTVLLKRFNTISNMYTFGTNYVGTTFLAQKITF